MKHETFGVTAKLVDRISVQCRVGECAVWDDRQNVIYWTDINSRRLHCHNPQTGASRVLDLPEMLGSFGLLESGGGLVAALESGFAILDTQTGALEWLDRSLAGSATVHLNDGRVDRAGRFWAGGMHASQAHQLEGEGCRLYCLSGRGEVRPFLGGIRVSNGLCWSPDGSRMYFADSPTRMIQAFDVDPDSAAPMNGRPFAMTAPGCYPDGATVDAAGRVWCALWGGGAVACYDDSGQPVAQIALPVSQITSVAFAGERLSTLYVTTAREGLFAETLRAEPGAGDVFVFETDVAGLAECRFRWPPG